MPSQHLESRSIHQSRAPDKKGRLHLVVLFFIALFYSGSSWSIQRYEKVETSIPIPAGYTEMLVPSNHGRLLALAPYGPFRYPSAKQNMQFMAFRNPSTKQVLYIQTTDPDGQVIDWQVTGSAANYSLKLSIFSLAASFPQGFYIVDETLTANDHADFYRKVAKKYKAWAINQKWAKRKASSVDRMATVAFAPDNSYSTVSTDIVSYVGHFGGRPSLGWIERWRPYTASHYGMDDALPDYRQGGLNLEPTSEESLKLLNQKQCSTIPYMNALIWDARIVENPQDSKTTIVDAMKDVWTKNPGARYKLANMIKNDQGQPVVMESDPPRPNLHYVCQSSTDWKNHFRDSYHKLAQRGWKGIYYDMAATTPPKLCYDANHGHDLADPLVWQNGIREVLSTLKSDSDTKHMLVMTEGNAEIYMDLVDVHLVYEDTATVDSNTPLNKLVPLFREVYGEVARTVGWTLFPPGSGKNDSHVTPEILRAASLKAANYGNRFFASPWFFGYTAGFSPKIQENLRSDERYATLFDVLNDPVHKINVEAGAGSSNWIVNGSLPPPVNVVDEETGEAAVQFGMLNRDVAGTSYELRNINEKEKRYISWDMKMKSSYYFLVMVEARDGNKYNLLYDDNPRNFRDRWERTVKVGLGADTKANQWRTIVRDLQSDLYAATGLELKQTEKILVMGNGLIDNISFSDAPKIYEDGQGAANWSIHGAGLGVTSVMDTTVNSQIIRLLGTTNRQEPKYFTLPLNDVKRFDVAWDMNTTMDYYVSFLVSADDGNQYRVRYDQSRRDFYSATGQDVTFGLGQDTKDGKWRTFRRDLAADLYFGANVNITKVISMNVYGTADIDNVRLWGTSSLSDPTRFPANDGQPDTTGMAVVPGRIEAETFSRASPEDNINEGDATCTVAAHPGVDIQVTTDVGGGCNIGWTQPDEWLDYDIFVPEAGQYELILRASTAVNDRYLYLEVDGVQTGGQISIMNRGDWQLFSDHKVYLNLTSGPHTLRIRFGNGYVNLNYLHINRASAPVLRTPVPVPATIAATAFSAFQEATAQFYGDSVCGTAPVDAEITLGSDGSCHLGYTTSGEWTEYQIDVAAQRDYDIVLSLATAENQKAVRLLINGESQAPITVANHGWQSFRPYTTRVRLPVGRHTLRVVYSTGNVNMKSVQIN